MMLIQLFKSGNRHESIVRNCIKASFVFVYSDKILTLAHLSPCEQSDNPGSGSGPQERCSVQLCGHRLRLPRSGTVATCVFHMNSCGMQIFHIYFCRNFEYEDFLILQIESLKSVTIGLKIVMNIL